MKILLKWLIISGMGVVASNAMAANQPPYDCRRYTCGFPESMVYIHWNSLMAFARDSGNLYHMRALGTLDSQDFDRKYVATSTRTSYIVQSNEPSKAYVEVENAYSGMPTDPQLKIRVEGFDTTIAADAPNVRVEILEEVIDGRPYVYISSLTIKDINLTSRSGKVLALDELTLRTRPKDRFSILKEELKWDIGTFDNTLKMWVIEGVQRRDVDGSVCYMQEMIDRYRIFIPNDDYRLMTWSIEKNCVPEPASRR